MKFNDVVLFNSDVTELYDSYEKSGYFDEIALDVGIDELSSEDKWHIVNEAKEWEYQDFVDNFDECFSNDEYVIFGQPTKWNRRDFGYNTGYFNSFKDFLIEFCHCYDDIEIGIKNNDLYLTGYHHDGTDDLIIRRSLLSNAPNGDLYEKLYEYTNKKRRTEKELLSYINRNSRSVAYNFYKVLYY